MGHVHLQCPGHARTKQGRNFWNVERLCAQIMLHQYWIIPKAHGSVFILMSRCEKIVQHMHHIISFPRIFTINEPALKVLTQVLHSLRPRSNNSVYHFIESDFLTIFHATFSKFTETTPCPPPEIHTSNETCDCARVGVMGNKTMIWESLVLRVAPEDRVVHLPVRDISHGRRRNNCLIIDRGAIVLKSVRCPLWQKYAP
mmetsp:Transcript_31568/g.58763  ORF Transcript_31568/g.58763 Transcript_31568/m.58763 type:complete len:200 (+) Transcript_31568:1457-2056(+)